ncbi:MAG: silent information regulator protein Sir2 [Phycisphaerae bacterium]|nr:silent information regulator protein Sir2 [Phycisphaerae bacterium]
MSKKVILILLLICTAASTLIAEDPKERQYFTPALNPKHKDKPQVTGWAQHRIDEKINRGMSATPDKEGKVYLGWRLLKSDAKGTAFNVYRSVEGGNPVRLNKEPVVATTDFIDTKPVMGRESTYWVKPVMNGRELEPSEKALLKPDAKDKPYYASIKFQGDYRPQRIAVADLNGDGAYDFVIKQPSQGIDPAGRPNTDGLTYKLEAYLNDGTFLWRKDLGPGIEPGIWYSPFVVYDFDGDGKAEVAAKTGPDDARESDGRVHKGPEWCSILDGMTGAEITRADWPPRDPRLGDYNRTNRNQMGMAYLDGKTPCLLVARGTYKLMVVDAYQYHNHKLERLWHWEGDDETPIIRSQGSHGMHSADVDGDGRDEVILGSVVLDDNGTCLWSTGLGHPDKCFVTDVDPTRPGMEIFYAIEPWHDDGKGVCLVEAKTGKIIWSIGHRTYHVGDGMVADIDPAIPGLECFATEDSKGGSRDRYMFSSDGKRLGTREDVPGCRNWIFWDADLLRETFGRGGAMGGGRFGSSRSISIVKYKGPTLNSDIEGSIMMMADILGDWREELVTILAGELRIYTTTIPAKDRRVCLMQDPVYRAEVAHRSMGYEQSPVTGYYLGERATD